MRNRRLLSALLMAGAVIASPAFAAHHHHAAKAAVNNSRNCNAMMNMANTGVNCGSAVNNNVNPNTNPTLAGADSLLQQSSATINQLQSDDNAVNLMRSAKAVFIIPGSAAANTTAGPAQAAGVLMMSNNGRWSNPAFFDVGAVAHGNQAAANSGANSGQIALFIMSNRAMKEFSGGTASLNTRRLHIVNYAPGSQQAPAANTDIVVWSASNANPPNVNVLSGIARLRTDAASDQAVYGTRNQHQIVAGRAPLTNQLATNLSSQTPAPQASTQVGMRDTNTRPG